MTDPSTATDHQRPTHQQPQITSDRPINSHRSTMTDQTRATDIIISTQQIPEHDRREPLDRKGGALGPLSSTRPNLCGPYHHLVGQPASEIEQPPRGKSAGKCRAKQRTAWLPFRQSIPSVGLELLEPPRHNCYRRKMVIILPTDWKTTHAF